MQGYNCSESTQNSYGASAYGSCAQPSIGAPDTGSFQAMFASAQLEILLPLAAMIVLTIIATLLVRRKKAKQ